LRREIDAVLSVRGEDREKRLLDSPNLPALVALMPAEEFYLTLKEVDPANAAQILSHARTEQVEFALDLELWKKDRLRRERVLPWLARMVECGDRALTRWLQNLDLADWTLMLGQVARVRVADDDIDPLQEDTGRTPVTVEGRYYLTAAQEAEPVVRDLLLTLHRVDPSLYAYFVEALLRDVDSELEEYVFQERQRRLAQRGFPEWEEALEVYARLEPEALASLPLRSAPPPGEPGEEPAVPPRYPIALPGTSPDFLVHALGRVHPGPELDALWSQLAHLTHKVLVADGLDPDRTESFQAALRKVAAYTSIGLELLCGPDEERAADLLERRWLEHLFRAGWTPIRSLRARAREIFEKGWPQGHKERLLFLDPPLPETLEGLLRAHPLWYVGEAETDPSRLFETLAEVRRAEHALDKIEFLGSFLFRVVELRLGDLQEAVQIDSDNLKGTTVFLTALVNAALDRSFRFAPVERIAVPRALQRVWGSARPPRRIRPGLEDTAVEWARSVASLSPAEEGLLREFVGQSFAILEEQFGHLAGDEAPDPRFTRGIWIT
jgi:hypothetical protein